MACSCCGDKATFILACSGAANTGYLADQVARGLRAKEVGGMTCLAALGADLPGYVESCRAADRNIVIDGCPTACGKKIFERLDIPCTHFVMTDFGVEKGKTAVTGDVIAQVLLAVKSRIDACPDASCHEDVAKDS
jgi:uncharacterized metal-binding protein